MLLIFDIDDTLVDTSGSILPHLLLKALRVLESRELLLGNFEKAFSTLQQIDSVSISSQHALSEFVELYGGKRRDADIALEQVYAPGVLPKPIHPVDGALSVLPDLGRDHTLCLVSKGKEALQKEKLRLAGIPIELFDYIYISEQPSKKQHYQKIIQRAGISPAKMLVVGDRIERDLTPAKELGISTVHMKWGRGLGYTGIKTDVDYTITTLEELRPILEEPSKEGSSHV